MDFSALLEEYRLAPDYAGQIEHVRVMPPRQPKYRQLRHELHDTVQGILDALGVSELWSHQAQAIDCALDGENVVVVSATASGKTLCYTIPIAQKLYVRPTRRALLVFPTKALAQDQLRKLAEFGAGKAFTAETYDGDTPGPQRRRIKKEAHVVLTNPDMLHVGILPYHHTWAELFRNLEYIVLDEVHVYRGVFGSHTANVIRRLRRIARHYGSDPRFICCSATIVNAPELCNRLTGASFSLVDDDGSPQGERVFAMWNPPVVNKRNLGRRSANVESAELLVKLMRRGVRSICFTLARRQAELILTYVKKQLEGARLADKIMAYRGGYLPAERREIERRLFDGELLAVTSTTALELGVDIGGLDATIMAGYPGSVASTWQQAGRAGRGKQQSLAVLVGLEGGVHQYLMQHPEYVLDGASESAIIDPTNRFIVAGHLLCAAYELALRDADEDLFGEGMTDTLEILAEHRYVTRRRDAWYWIDPDTYPAAAISIRSAGTGGYDILVSESSGDDVLLGTVDDASAFRMIHEGAVYLHAGNTYLVEKLDLEERIAHVRAAQVDYYTVPMGISEVRVEQVQASGRLCTGSEVCLGDLEVKSAVLGYSMFRQVTEENLGQRELQLPTSSYETVGAWIRLGEEDVRLLAREGRDLMGSIHALEHAMIQLLPLVALCDHRDIGGASHSSHSDLDGPGVFMYDGYPGGIGICETAYENMHGLIAATVDTIAACPCEKGCPSCVQAPDCGSGNEPLDKQGALDLVRAWSAEARA